MKNFIQLGNVDVLPLLLQLERHPELWNQHGGRREQEHSAHVETSDLWLRWRPPEQLTGPQSYNEKFAELEWYPAMGFLPAVRQILMDIMAKVGGLALGGALITKIPPGGKVAPHSDAAGWHANYYRTKVYTTIKSNTSCLNWVEEESVWFAPGSVWTFDNLKEHAVYNNGSEDRITMMCAIRCD